MKVSPATLRSLALLGATLAFTPIQQAHCAWPSPVGTTWDAIVSGSGQRGIAFLTFAGSGDLTGYQLLAPSAPAKSTFDPRTPYGDVGRQTITADEVTKSNLFGFAPVQGTWGFNERGQLIGGYVLRMAGYETNTSLQTGISFTGKVVPGKRLSLVAYSPVGKLTYSGIAYKTNMPDLSGNWYATRKANGQTYIDAFPLSRNMEGLLELHPDLADYSGIYYTGGPGSAASGMGPGYGFGGFTLLSSQKKIGYYFESWTVGSSNAVITLSTNLAPDGSEIVTTNVTYESDLPSYATFGSFAQSKKGNHKSSTSGVLDTKQKVTLNAVWLSPLAPPPAEE